MSIEQERAYSNMRKSVMDVIADVYDRAAQIDEAANEVIDLVRAALQSQDREDSQWCADDVHEFRCIGKAINRAATDLPENWGIRISLELGAGTVYLSTPDGTETMIDMSGELFSDQINAAIDHARRIVRNKQ